MAISNDSLFSAKPIPTSTQTELNQRAKPEWNPMNGQAKTWIHVMSLAEGAPFPLSTFDSYSLAYDQYNRPRRLIQGLKVAAKGEYGTTRSATLELLFFSDEELNYFSDAYLIPDMSVRVQWGWSVSATGEQMQQPITGQLLDNVALAQMQSITDTSANYEGFQGRVVSWNVTLDPKDNVWQVTLELIGAANSVSETGVSAKSDACHCLKKVTGQTADGENEEKEVVEESSALQAALLELFNDANKIVAVKSGAGNYDGEWVAERLNYPGFSRDESGKEDSDGMLWMNADLDAEETYISWGTVESIFSVFSAQQLSSEGPASFKVDSRGLVIKVPTTDRGKWFSADPRICILPGGGLNFEEPTEWTDYTAVIPGVGPLIAAAASTPFKRTTGNCFQDDNHIKLTDIRVSVIHLLKRLKEFESNKDTIMTAFKTLLSDINGACGGPWEFELIDVSTQSGATTSGVAHLAIVDANAPELKEEPFVFKATPGSGGFCREIKLELKMTDAMKAQALYGANGSTDIPDPGRTPCASRFMQITKDRKRNTGKIQAPNNTNNILEMFCKAMEICNQSNEKHPVDLLQKEVVGVNIDGGRSYLEVQKRKGELNALQGSGISSYCATAALPMQFSATLTGVGGFKWGQSVTCDRLPEDMRTLMKYQVTTVEHDVTPDDWTTTINTVARKRF